MDQLIAVAVGAVLTALPLILALRFVTGEADKGRKVAEARAIAQQTRITDLENRLMSHTWGEYAQLQNGVDNHTAQTVRAVNSFGEVRAEEAFGETEEDLVDAFLAANGVDLEGPTVG